MCRFRVDMPAASSFPGSSAVELPSYKPFCFWTSWTGVFCQSAIQSAQHDHELFLQNMLAERDVPFLNSWGSFWGWGESIFVGKHHPWQIQGSLEADQEPLCQAGNKMTRVPTNSMQHSATHFDSILVAKLWRFIPVLLWSSLIFFVFVPHCATILTILDRLDKDGPNPQIDWVQTASHKITWFSDM